MTARGELVAGDVRALISVFAAALDDHAGALNRLNVYPVPDGDTGTNMSLTVRSVVEELTSVAGDGDADMATLCKAVSHGSLMGARGNSGVILSQLLRGMSEVLREGDSVDAAICARSLARASELSDQAVMKPVEGTILTVLRDAADAASAAAGSGASLVELLHEARQEAQRSLDRTPELLPALAAAGVVDAGAAGFLLLLDAALHVVDGRPIPAPPPAPESVARQTTGTEPAAPGGDVSDLRYEVMYLLDAPDEAIPAFREVWAGIGDSIVVVGGDGIWNCHIHTDDIGGSIEAAIQIGRPRDIRVTDLMEQVEEERWVREADVPETPPAQPVPCGVVAVAVGEGIRRLFGSLGVQEVVSGGQSMNPSTKDLVEAVEAVPAPEVVILPNNKNIIAVAEQVQGQTAKTVRVLPTRSVVEGFAALLAYDPESDAETNAAGMAAACDEVVPGEVTRAVRDSMTPSGPVSEGDHMGLCRGEIVAAAPSALEAALGLLEHMVGQEDELVTILEGEGSSAALTRRLTEWLREHRPGVETEIHQGGQPLYPYLFGVE